MDFFARPQSAAIKIVNPNSQPDDRPRKDSVQRQCRNILLYGFCKYQDKGCIYFHPSSPEDQTEQPRAGSPATTLTADAIEFVPKSGTPATPQTTDFVPAADAPAFIPSNSTSSFVPTPEAPVFVPKSVASLSKPDSPAPPSSAFSQQQLSDSAYGYDTSTTDLDNVSAQMADVSMDTSQFYDPHFDPNAPYFQPEAPVYARQPLDYHLYTPFVPPSESQNEIYFVASQIEHRRTLQSRNETIRSVAPQGLNLPEEIQGYHTLVPLEPALPPNERRKMGNWNSIVYRAINSSDGVPYAFKRIENYRLTQQSAFGAIEVWSKIRHPSIVSLHEAFTTRAFGDNSLVVVYAYHPEAKTMHDYHFKSPTPTFSSSGSYGHHYKYNRAHQQQQAQLHHSPQAISERTIWSYIVQISSAIKKVHDAGQAVRMVDISKILVTGKNRVKISSCGLVDVLMHNAPDDPDLSYLQQQDLIMFGKLLYTLCTNNTTNVGNPAVFQKGMEAMARNYSSELKNVVIWLTTSGHQQGSHNYKSINQLLSQIADRVTAEMDDALTASDRLESDLLSELENARLVRLLCKFGFINERPEFARDARWSETGDRYIIKLFRDYVFHQVDEHGHPVVGLTHVLTCLSKLDSGTDERIMLVSRDEQSCLVVSYKDVKACLESAFRDLQNAGIAPATSTDFSMSTAASSSAGSLAGYFTMGQYRT